MTTIIAAGNRERRPCSGHWEKAGEILARSVVGRRMETTEDGSGDLCPPCGNVRVQGCQDG